MTEVHNWKARLDAIEQAVRLQPVQTSVEDYDPVPDEVVLTAIAELMEDSAAHMKRRLRESIALSDARMAEMLALRAAHR